jgi:hypothetical protein
LKNKRDKWLRQSRIDLCRQQNQLPINNIRRSWLLKELSEKEAKSGNDSLELKSDWIKNPDKTNEWANLTALFGVILPDKIPRIMLPQTQK